MYKGLKIAAIVPVLNEESHIGTVLSRVPREIVDETIVVDDGSTDASADISRGLGATVIELPKTLGVGAALRRGYRFVVERDFDVAIVMAGNNKDAPEEILQLVDPIAVNRADVVQGSRYLDRRTDYGDMPGYRKVATRIHPRLFSLVAGQRMTDSTNGFRAVRTELFLDPRINLAQPWLDQYELEPYLLFKAIELGYRVVEVPVTKIYPPKELGQTKMRPLVGWWSILRPIVLLGLRLKR